MKKILLILLFSLFQIIIFETIANKKILGKQVLTIEKFKVLVFVNSGKESELKQALEVLKEKLTQISNIIPPQKLELLRNVPIWLEYKFDINGAMCYHPSKEWVVEHGYPAEIAKSIEISNLKNFLSWQELNQPYMVLHELAHAYHDRVLGFDNSEVIFAYQKAVASKKYENVEYNLGGKKRAYALNNEKEYFAEITESYLGINDFFPFNKSQLKKFDPTGYELMQKTWEKN